jgi:protein-S-isoprenylcysteine O-methyltransferase Ste14
MPRDIYLRATRGLVLLPILLGLLLFLPAGTLDYWQGWLFTAVFFLCSLFITVYLARYDPALLARRMRGGPWAEKETAQKIIVAVAMISFFATIALGGFDRRYGWSQMPVSLVLLGNLLLVLSYVGFWLIFRENSFVAATVEVMADQKVISTGPYALVRHPMYAVALIMIPGMALALGSWWALLAFPLAVVGIVWRLLDEEKLLARELAGYDAYRSKVRYRLIPFVW